MTIMQVQAIVGELNALGADVGLATVMQVKYNLRRLGRPCQPCDIIAAFVNPGTS